MTPEALALARIVYDYQVLGHQPIAADVMIALGTNDVRVAHHAADLYQRGFAPLIVCTGGLAHQDDILATGWSETEAAVYRRALVERGVPDDRILEEPRATNTAENIRFSRALLRDRGITARNVLLAVKPFIQRRAAATFCVEWPEVPFSLSSWPAMFDEYCTGELTAEKITHIMMGDLQRIWIYARRGWSAPQPLPDEVRAAYEGLRKLGFTGRLTAE
jgi:uncharacterized SAM-binding protein YcdF (DUF218 family)